MTLFKKFYENKTLNPLSSILKKLVLPQLVNKLHKSYWKENSSPVSFVPVVSQINPVQALLSCVSKICLMLIFHLRLGLCSRYFLQVSPSKPFIYFCSPSTYHMPRKLHLIYFSTLIMFSDSWRSSLCSFLLFPLFLSQDHMQHHITR
jgi:hypothetical protein